MFILTDFLLNLVQVRQPSVVSSVLHYVDYALFCRYLLIDVQCKNKCMYTMIYLNVST